jgi:hypothetical protein
VRRVVDHLLFLFLGPVPSFSAGLWLLGKFFGEIFDIDIYPLVSVIIFYFLRFPLINLPEQFLFTTNPLSPFDYDPFNKPDTRSLYRVSLTYLSSIDRFKQSRHQYRSSIATDLPSIPPSIPIFHRNRHRYRSSIDTAIDTDLPSLPLFHRYRHRYRSSIDTAIDTDLPFDNDPFNIPDTRSSYRVSLTNPLTIDPSTQFRVSTSILPFLPCNLLVKLIWKINPILQAFGTFFSRLATA